MTPNTSLASLLAWLVVGGLTVTALSLLTDKKTPKVLGLVAVAVAHQYLDEPVAKRIRQLGIQ